jgi:hypothetical protein
MSFGKPPWTFDEHNQADHLIDADGNHIGDMRTPELASQVVEAIRAAGLWERLVTAWESADGVDDQEQDVFASAVAALVAEWQGFAAGEEPARRTVHYHRPDGTALCGSSEKIHSTQPINCSACLAGLRDAIAMRNAARERAKL